ncbi:MAG: homocysteine S-methyltransferase [Actinomycetia bacterium]|nr:homocysteine S-methyltransferase [Actinomycetes bacterium]
MDLFTGEPAILDGGLATELERRGNDLSDELWSARLLVDDPEEIVAAHETFFRAGAVVATTATYQASFDGFAARDIDRREATRLMRRAVELAAAARDAVSGDGGRRWVAASAGPYGAALADGSEYRGRYGLTLTELSDWHAPRLDVLCEAGADVLALETVPDADEAAALVQAMSGRTVPAWLTYTIDGDRTRAGQPLPDAFAVVADAPEIIAVGVNCCAPGDVEHAVRVAHEVTGKPVIAYPNSGEGWVDRHWAGESAFDAGMAERWVTAGAVAVGGCCRVTPDDIAVLARTLREVPPG